MIGLIFALHSEAKQTIEKIEKLQEIKLLDKTAYKGVLFNKEVILVISGIGKVSASISTQALIDKYNPEYILNIGTSGGTDTSVKVKNFYVIDKCFQFDFDVTEIDDVKIGYIQEYDRVFFPTHVKGLDFLNKTSLATADRFSNEAKDLKLIKDNGCAVRDMEGSAIAQTCLSNTIPFVCIKGVTDIYGTNEDFYTNLTKVCLEIPNTIEKVFENVKFD